MRIMDGIYEKVDYQNDFSILLHINKETDNYSVHWHTAIEIIMPLENFYTVNIGKVTYHLEVGDILIIPPGTLHELTAPASGLRLILLFDFSLISNLKGLSNILTVLNQPRLITATNAPDIHSQLSQLLKNITVEYQSSNTLREAAIYALIIQLFVITGRKYMSSEALFPDVKLNKQREYIEKFNIIFEYINSNYEEDISLDDISQMRALANSILQDCLNALPICPFMNI